MFVAYELGIPIEEVGKKSTQWLKLWLGFFERKRQLENPKRRRGDGS